MDSFSVYGQLELSGKMNFSHDLLLQLYKISLSNRPCGIIDNNTNVVEWRNRASFLQLEEWGINIVNTQLLWEPSRLKEVKDTVAKAQNGEMFKRTYNLIIPGVGNVLLTDQFTRVENGGIVKRVFEQLECKVL